MKIFKKLTLAALLVCLTRPASLGTVDANPAKVKLIPCDLEVRGASTRTVAAQCGSIEVPANWKEPDGKKLTIFFDILRAANPTGIPIFHFEGGPGASAISNF